MSEVNNSLLISEEEFVIKSFKFLVGKGCSLFFSRWLLGVGV